MIGWEHPEYDLWPEIEPDQTHFVRNYLPKVTQAAAHSYADSELVFKDQLKKRV